MTTITEPARGSVVRSRSHPAAGATAVGRGVRVQLVITGAVVAAVLLGYTQLALPRRHLLSDYVHVVGGLEPFVAGLLALAAACFALASLVMLTRPVVPRLLRVAGGALVLTAAFPTDATRLSAVSLSGQIHRYAALVVFVALPVAGWLLARRRQGAAHRVVRILAGVAAVALVGTLLVHPLSPVAHLLGTDVWEAVLERALAGTEIVLVAAMALAPVPTTLTSASRG